MGKDFKTDDLIRRCRLFHLLFCILGMGWQNVVFTRKQAINSVRMHNPLINKVIILII